MNKILLILVGLFALHNTAAFAGCPIVVYRANLDELEWNAAKSSLQNLGYDPIETKSSPADIGIEANASLTDGTAWSNIGGKYHAEAIVSGSTSEHAINKSIRKAIRKAVNQLPKAHCEN